MTHAMLLRVSAVRRALPANQRLTTSLIGQILTGWDGKLDTTDIAGATGRDEAEVARIIALDLNCRHAARPRAATA